ncbi:hypothetical protein O3G_MSEX007673 [Manduca sexta]|uniref:Uncharacterized protein n=1 Tax=Manduca sexta TaxID=7130 RepID=A0A922CNK5_MANSE|nr:hypothetical protein O3G_MSEX007673 [Manduca sexta]
MTNVYLFISCPEINGRERSRALDKTCRLRVRNNSLILPATGRVNVNATSIHPAVSNAAYYLSVDNAIAINHTSEPPLKLFLTYCPGAQRSYSYRDVTLYDVIRLTGAVNKDNNDMI